MFLHDRDIDLYFIPTVFHVSDSNPKYHPFPLLHLLPIHSCCTCTQAHTKENTVVSWSQFVFRANWIHLTLSSYSVTSHWYLELATVGIYTRKLSKHDKLGHSYFFNPRPQLLNLAYCYNTAYSHICTHVHIHTHTHPRPNLQ